MRKGGATVIEPTLCPAPSPLQDGEVIARVLGGEDALFEVLMRRHNTRVYRAVRSILRDEAECEDAMQQAWLSAYTHLADFAGEASLGTWLVRIALNAALARLRGPERQFRFIDVALVEEDAMPDPLHPERRAAARELVGLLEDAVDRLPPGLRAVYVLREVERLSTAETAHALGLGVEAVKVRLHRARHALRDALAAELGAAAPEAFTFLVPRCDRVVAAVLAALHPPRTA
jgi:RNA polymerase sigma-70 factor (ECF subfamily)